LPFLEKEAVVHGSIDLQKQLYGKVLLIPSILLTKGLITAHHKIAAGEMKEMLDYLIGAELLTNEKYLKCGKRKIEAYLKYVPENIGSRKDKYLLQGRLLALNIGVDEYIESLKTMHLLTTSLLPSDLLIATLQQIPYAQLNIDFLLNSSGKYVKYHR
jgi:hypothetical protein